jgi:hypothetical protein
MIDISYEQVDMSLSLAHIHFTSYQLDAINKKKKENIPFNNDDWIVKKSLLVTSLNVITSLLLQIGGDK